MHHHVMGESDANLETLKIGCMRCYLGRVLTLIKVMNEHAAKSHILLGLKRQNGRGILGAYFLLFYLFNEIAYLSDLSILS